MNMVLMITYKGIFGSFYCAKTIDMPFVPQKDTIIELKQDTVKVSRLIYNINHNKLTVHLRSIAHTSLNRTDDYDLIKKLYQEDGWIVV